MKSISKHSVLIASLFFGIPLLIFVGGYYLETKFHFTNKNIDTEESQTRNVMFHSLGTDKSLSISGYIENRISSNEFDIRDLEVINQENGDVLARHNNENLYRINLGDKVVKISKIINLPLGKNEKWIKKIISQKKLYLQNNLIKIKNESLNNTNKENEKLLNKFKKEYLDREGRGFDDIHKNKRLQYIKKYLAKLFLCATCNDKQALTVLQNFEQYHSTTLTKKNKKWCENLIDNIRNNSTEYE